MLRGKEIASRHIRSFGTLYQKDDIPVPSLSDSFVTDSTEFTFSDKLMMFIISALVASSLPSYATGMANSMRHDLQLDYVRFSAEIAKYASEGVQIMIDNKWIEQPPQAVRHESLIKV